MESEKRLIDANKLNAVLQNMAEHLLESGNSMTAAHLLYCQEVVDRQRTVNAVEIVHGQWSLHYVVSKLEGYGVRYYYHAKCKVNPRRMFENADAYCPCCGAMMDGGVDYGL